MIRKLKVWPNFSRNLKEIYALQRIFHTFRISYIHHGQDAIAYYLAWTARAFQRDFYFFGVLFRFGSILRTTSHIYKRLFILIFIFNIKT